MSALGVRFIPMFHSMLGYISFAVSGIIAILSFLIYIDTIESSAWLLEGFLMGGFILYMIMWLVNIWFQYNKIFKISSDDKQNKAVIMYHNDYHHFTKGALSYFVVGLFLGIFMIKNSDDINYQPLIGNTPHEISVYNIYKGFTLATIGIVSIIFTFLTRTDSNLIYIIANKQIVLSQQLNVI